MVNELPELQGIAGRYYAQRAGETSEVALAIDEGYRPRFAADDIAASPVGKVLAIAERLDTLAGELCRGPEADRQQRPCPRCAATHWAGAHHHRVRGPS